MRVTSPFPSQTSADTNRSVTFLGLARTIYIRIYGLHTVFLAGNSLNIRSYTCIYTVLANPTHFPNHFIVSAFILTSTLLLQHSICNTKGIHRHTRTHTHTHEQRHAYNRHISRTVKKGIMDARFE